MFSDRLNSLMNIAEVSNSMVARAINMNSSHVGRLRNGTRKLPKYPTFIGDLSSYLTRHITKDYQFSALVNLTNVDKKILDNNDSLKQYIENWLVGDINPPQEKNENSPHLEAIEQTDSLQIRSNIFDPKSLKPYYFGNDGKRQAMAQLLDMSSKEYSPSELLFYSDEDLTWLYESPSYAQSWSDSMMQLITRGDNFQVIQTTQRKMDELIQLLQLWAPLYLTGKISSYYYPGLRDGVFQRTMIIVPNTAAITSSSVHENYNNVFSTFITNKNAISAVSVRFTEILSICKPLVQTFNDTNYRTFYRVKDFFNSRKGDVYLYGPIPPVSTLPYKLVRELSDNTPDLQNIWHSEKSFFNHDLSQSNITVDVLNPDYVLQLFNKGINATDILFSTGGFRYSKEQYEQHLLYLKSLALDHNNLFIKYHNPAPSNITLWGKEDIGIILTNGSLTPRTFVISEQNLVRAIWYYLNHKISSS